MGRSDDKQNDQGRLFKKKWGETYSGNMNSDFKSRVFEVVKHIPKGQTMTYKQVAMAAGSPNAFRAVGTVLKSNYNPSIPCHRVIRSNGEAGNYNRGNEKKIQMLKEESSA